MKKMNRGFWWYVAGVAVLVLILILVSVPRERVLLGPDDGTTSTRSFEGNRMGLPVTVNMDIDYDSGDGTPFVDVVQFIPDGFDLVYEGSSVPRADLAAYGSNPIQFLDFSPASGTLSYVLVPDPNILCAQEDWNSTEIKTLYLAPPQEPRTERGEVNLNITNETVVVRFSKDEARINGMLIVYLYVYPACYDSYEVAQIVPAGWTILDRGEGENPGSPNQVKWTVSCSGACESKVLSYKVSAPSSAAEDNEFMTQFKMPAVMGFPVVFYESISTIDVTCTVGGACASQEACQGEYCLGQIKSCFGYSCENACTGRDGYYCASGECGSGDVHYQRGDVECGTGFYCCMELPAQTCEEIGGYCVLDDIVPMQECPPGFSENPDYNIKCNNGFEIPLRGGPYPICCMPPV